MPACSQANPSLSNVQNAAAPPHPTAPSSFQLLNVTPPVSNPPQPSTADATTRRKHKRCGKVTAACERQLPKFQCEQQGECAIHKLPRMNNTSSNSRPKKEKKNSPRSRGNTNQHPSNQSTGPSAITLAVPPPQPGPVMAKTVPCASQPTSTDTSAQTQSTPVESMPSLARSQPKSTATAVPAAAATLGPQKTDRVYKMHMKSSFSESYLQNQHEKMLLQNKNLNAKKIKEKVSEKVQIVIWDTWVQAQNVKGQPRLVSYPVPPGNVRTNGELAVKIDAELFKAWRMDQPP
ncbi:uncharacterized protein PHACADRAFT_202730, partial [Phanerochaete carnosa HHB-10118-sp]